MYDDDMEQLERYIDLASHGIKRDLNILNALDVLATIVKHMLENQMKRDDTQEGTTMDLRLFDAETLDPNGKTAVLVASIDGTLMLDCNGGGPSPILDMGSFFGGLLLRVTCGRYDAIISKSEFQAVHMRLQPYQLVSIDGSYALVDKHNNRKLTIGPIAEIARVAILHRMVFREIDCKDCYADDVTELGRLMR